MLTGHYAPAYLLRGRFPSAPLWMLFLAVQAVDVAFFALVPFGIERLAIEPSARGPLAMDLQSIPYTHSLTMTFVYVLLLLVAGLFVRRAGLGLAVALAVASHWALDLLVHVHDLPLTAAQEVKVGFGLWEYPLASYLLAVGLVLGSGWWLGRRMESRGARRWLYGSMGLLVLIETGYVLLPPPPSPGLMAAGAELLYAAIAGVGWQIDRRFSVTFPASARTGRDRR